MDILTSVHLGKRSHWQTCMLHFSEKHHICLTPVLTTRTSFSNSGLSAISTVFTYEIEFWTTVEAGGSALRGFLQN